MTSLLTMRASSHTVAAYETNQRSYQTRRWQAAVCQERKQNHRSRAQAQRQIGQSAADTNRTLQERSAILPAVGNPPRCQRLLLEGGNARRWNLRLREDGAGTGNQNSLLRHIRATRGHRGGGAAVKCPKCGHTFKAANQVKGGKTRWAGMNKAQRKQAASDAAKARWAKRPNAEVSDQRGAGSLH